MSAGLWVKNETGYIKKDGPQFVWNVVVPQMGYWLAAFPSSSGSVTLLPAVGSVKLLSLLLKATNSFLKLEHGNIYLGALVIKLLWQQKQ